MNACKDADVIVAAVGIPSFVKGDWVKKGAVVIDVGIHYSENQHDEYNICGDVDFQSVSKGIGCDGAISPVPGGVGPMTIAMLLVNTLRNATNRAKKKKKKEKRKKRPTRTIDLENINK